MISLRKNHIIVVILITLCWMSAGMMLNVREAHAVLTINNFVGFETQGTEEAASSAGTLTYETTNQRSGDSALILNASADQFDVPWINDVADQGTDYVFGVALRKTGNPSSPSTILSIIDDGGTNVILEIELNTSGALVLRDANSGLLDTSSALNNDQWYYIEIYAELNSASGAWEWFIDNTSEGSNTGADLTDAGAFGAVTSLLRLDGPASNTVLVDDVYIRSGATAATDRLGDAEVFGYQTGHSTDTDLGDALATGEWNDTADTFAVEESNANVASRTGATALSSRTNMDDANVRGLGPGPNADPNVDGDFSIKAAKYVFNLKRSNGSGTSMGYLYGNSGDGITSSGDIESSLTLSYAIFTVISEAASVVPLSSEYFQIGLEAGTTDTGNRDFFMSEAWAMLLHVPTPPNAPQSLELEGQPTPPPITGVTDLTPEFSAIFDDDDTSDTASAYRIEVNTQADFAGTVMWDSGTLSVAGLNGAPFDENERIPNGSPCISNCISYAGTALDTDGSTYFWRIAFEDAAGNFGAVSATVQFTMASGGGGPCACSEFMIESEFVGEGELHILSEETFE